MQTQLTTAALFWFYFWLIKRSDDMINIVGKFSASSETSKWLLQDVTLLPSSIYYKVLIFNAIKYLSGWFWVFCVGRRETTSFGSALNNKFHVTCDKFCWYFHVFQSTLFRLTANGFLYSRIEWQRSFTTNWCTVFKLYVQCCTVL